MGPKIPYLGIFWLQFDKNDCEIFNQYSHIFENIMFHPKQTKNKLRTKNVLLGLWALMFKNCCHICNHRPPICIIGNFRAKIGILKFGTKNA